MCLWSWGMYNFILVVLSMVIKELLVNFSLLNDNGCKVDLIDFGKWLYNEKDIKLVVFFEFNKVVILKLLKCKNKYSKWLIGLLLDKKFWLYELFKLYVFDW